MNKYKESVSSVRILNHCTSGDVRFQFNSKYFSINIIYLVEDHPSEICQREVS